MDCHVAALLAMTKEAILRTDNDGALISTVFVPAMRRLRIHSPASKSRLPQARHGVA